MQNIICINDNKKIINKEFICLINNNFVIFDWDLYKSHKLSIKNLMHDLNNKSKIFLNKA